MRTCRAQVTSDFVIILFVVMAVAAGMSTYVKNAVFARYRAAHRYMYGEVNALYQNAELGLQGSARSFYEPYYVNTSTRRTTGYDVTDHQWPGLGSSAISRKDTAFFVTEANTVSTQLSPKDAD